LTGDAFHKHCRHIHLTRHFIANGNGAHGGRNDRGYIAEARGAHFIGQRPA
jgi:hypothetical protein